MKDLRRNGFIDLMRINEFLFEENENFIRANVPGLGDVTFYPKKDSLNIHRGNRWENEGFNFVKCHINGKKDKWDEAVEKIEGWAHADGISNETRIALLECIDLIEETKAKK